MIVNVSVPWIRHGFLPTPPYSGEACRFCAFGMMMMHLGPKEIAHQNGKLFFFKNAGDMVVLRYWDLCLTIPSPFWLWYFQTLRFQISRPRTTYCTNSVWFNMISTNPLYKSSISPKTKGLPLRSCLISQGDGKHLFWKKSSLLWKPPQRDVRF